MSDHAIEPARHADLRHRATSRLVGAAANQESRDRTTDALAALYTLASSTTTASDALALLHELQVHQVELDLQAEELRESRAELESALRYQAELYDSQPVGCFTIDARLVVQELNRTGATMLGVERDDGPGLQLGHFLSARSRLALQELFSRAVGGEDRVSGVLQLCRAGEADRRVQAHLGAHAGAQRCLVVFSDRTDDLDAEPGLR